MLAPQKTKQIHPPGPTPYLIFIFSSAGVTFLIVSFMFGGSVTYLHITLSAAAKQNKVSP
jgi:hypothetical protein